MAERSGWLSGAPVLRSSQRDLFRCLLGRPDVEGCRAAEGCNLGFMFSTARIKYAFPLEGSLIAA